MTRRDGSKTVVVDGKMAESLDEIEWETVDGVLVLRPLAEMILPVAMDARGGGAEMPAGFARLALLAFGLAQYSRAADLFMLAIRHHPEEGATWLSLANQARMRAFQVKDRS